ncbi:MAG: DEAD/DEAH box helicase, partial [Thermoplasmata archaeon]
MNIIKRFYDEVFEPYKMIIQDQFKIHDSFQWVNNEWRERLDWNNIVNGPYLERAIIYEEWPEIDTLHLQQKTIEILRSKIGAAKLYRHQYEVIQKIKESKSTIIATGTNSGKTLSFQIPIINDLISDNSPGLRAIIIYPMNALANDQLEEWSLLLKNCPNILFGIYTGETPQNHSVYEKNLEIKYEQKLRKNPEISEQSKESEKRKLVCMEKERDQKEFPNKLLTREQIRKNPPHILITNFAMLEYILERPVDAPIFEKHRLKYLVMDEIHAYRGAQATEIAFLIRRLKDRLGISHIVCIATSATLANKNDSSTRESIRKFASSLFMEEFEDFNPISEYEKKLNAPSSPIYFRPGDYVELANLLKENKELMNVNINGKQVSLKELIEN